MGLRVWEKADSEQILSRMRQTKAGVAEVECRHMELFVRLYRYYFKILPRVRQKESL